MVPPIRRPSSEDIVPPEWTEKPDQLVYCLCGDCDYCVGVDDNQERDE